MEFGLFGTFSVWRDGRRLTDREIGARKARMLLKLLVVERGRPVTIDRAVDALWGDAPPERAEENVATVVSRLRAALGADVVAGGRGGYQLTPTAAVDVDRVVSLLDEADARLVCGEAPLARAAVDQALAFVARGDLLCDEADTPWADEARRDMERLAQSR